MELSALFTILETASSVPRTLMLRNCLFSRTVHLGVSPWATVISLYDINRLVFIIVCQYIFFQIGIEFLMLQNIKNIFLFAQQVLCQHTAGRSWGLPCHLDTGFLYFPVFKQMWRIFVSFKLFLLLMQSSRFHFVEIKTAYYKDYQIFSPNYEINHEFKTSEFSDNCLIVYWMLHRYSTMATVWYY